MKTKLVFSLILGTFGVWGNLAHAGIPVTDAANIAQAQLLNTKALEQINQLNSLIGIGNAQLDELEALYAALGNPRAISGSEVTPTPSTGATFVNSGNGRSAGGFNPASLIQGIPPNISGNGGGLLGGLAVDPNTIINVKDFIDSPSIDDLGSLAGINVQGLVGDFGSGFVSNFLGMDFESWKQVFAAPKETLGGMVMERLSRQIQSRMNLPYTAQADLEYYLKQFDLKRLKTESANIAMDIATYYFAQYAQRTVERTERNSALTAKNTAISEEIEARVQHGQADLNEQVAGMNELSATQNEILLNTATNLNEANEALIGTDNAILEKSEELNEFERTRERVRALSQW